MNIGGTTTAFLASGANDAFYQYLNSYQHNDRRHTSSSISDLQRSKDVALSDRYGETNLHRGATIIDEDFPHLSSGWGTGASPVPQGALSNLYGSLPIHSSLASVQQQQHHHPYKLPYAPAQQPFSSAVFHNNKQYANFLRDNTGNLDNGFHIQSNEDFPALPAASNHFASQSGQQTKTQESESLGEENPSKRQPSETSDSNASKKKPGIQTLPDGRVTNIPPGMLNDQYGMAGLLTFLRTIESDPSIVALALGHDLTNLGLNLNATKRNLFQTFGGPWADYPCRIQDLDVKVPEEYLTNTTIRDKLPNIKLNKLQDDVLFYLFYNCPGEVYQVAAASELFQREWRFHKSERLWITRAPYSNPPREHTGSYEKCSYLAFEPTQWRKVPREMVLEYKELEGRPNPLGETTTAYPSSFGCGGGGVHPWPISTGMAATAYALGGSAFPGGGHSHHNNMLPSAATNASSNNPGSGGIFASNATTTIVNNSVVSSSNMNNSNNNSNNLDGGGMVGSTRAMTAGGGAGIVGTNNNNPRNG